MAKKPCSWCGDTKKVWVSGVNGNEVWFPCRCTVKEEEELPKGRERLV